MPAKSPPLSSGAAATLAVIGSQIRERRKALKVSAIAAAQASGMSRVTLYRIEKGEPSVTVGAYLQLLDAIGLTLELVNQGSGELASASDGLWLPARIVLDNYPQLRKLAWQIHAVDDLSPSEALSIYERNWRHIDLDAMQPSERQLIDALRVALAGDASV